ncbi:polymorphic toxin-type HINT domain-containing protein [Tuwongella immobilis]|uniref:Intein C-terminal splicing domain-containing protein n=1 Tax=Tuwongella immobilis TaxID=692036 RepID=A0A6C2YUI1_9BACT|nr:polymorphic toxin-type HINT domain-containing protein [Tuwongella immobilis]VIP04575.1 YD repeat protein OS=Isosphaera pallida (strain ATCC 43644 / DSM 9630 / IS1B) GN=Isop_2419 PE=4 SV=1: PT-HINT [Tuwongella immobilis]VTS06511.1 YD repeat protein OS=Isosphaera pallida (strain ATCC 43644 / DSM 9630 / IS1B) GN=Isop_2419 PE=4 SV=1: PT-HINT [Tuwongella immobilis]
MQSRQPAKRNRAVGPIAADRNARRTQSDGTSKPIEEIGVGEMVLSRDEHSPESPASGKVVEEVFVRTAEILRLTLSGGVTIDTTAEHPFFEESLGWIEARSLTPGHQLRTLDGSSIDVESLAETGQWQPVYNLRVADWHTYFVGDDEWGFAVWAHNAYGQFVEYASNNGLTAGQARYAFRVLRQRGETALRAYLARNNVAAHVADAAIAQARIPSARKINQVINETMQRTGPPNFTSRTRLTHNEALDAAAAHLAQGGAPIVELGRPGSGVFRSGVRQARIDEGSLTGAHGNIGPHIHLERLPYPGAPHANSNNHIPLFGPNNG